MEILGGLVNNKDDFFEAFRMGETIAQGAFGQIHEVCWSDEWLELIFSLFSGNGENNFESIRSERNSNGVFEKEANRTFDYRISNATIRTS